MMDQQSLIAKITPLLFDRVWSVRDRKELLMEAFFSAHRWVLRQIEIDGSPDVFTVNCLQTLWERDCTLVEPLLTALQRTYGTGQQAEIDHLITELRRLCAAERRSAVRQAIPPLRKPVAAPTRDRPTLFLSHTDEEVALAGRLQDDLARRGHPCWIRARSQKGSDAWLADVAAGLSNSYAVVVLAGPAGRRDRWLQVELLAARDKRKLIIPLTLGAVRLPISLPADTPVVSGQDSYEEGLTALLQRLPAPPPAPPAASWPSPSPTLVTRAAELLYVDRLKLAELKHVAQYTQLSGESQLRRTRGGRLALQPVVARSEFTHSPWRQMDDPPVVERRFEDAVAELKTIRRAVLLGEPGAGKTTTLYKLAADLIDAALLDRTAPIPVMVRLGAWTEADEPFAPFLRRSAGELGADWDDRLRNRRLALLLDGLNEIPAAQQAAKYRALDAYLDQFPALMAIVSCRGQDYPPERALALDRVTVAPLDPVRVHEFVHNYLDNYLDRENGPTAGDDLFWKLAGADTQQMYERFAAALGDKLPEPFAAFWLADGLPNGLEWGYENWSWQNWVKKRARPANLLHLAANPYMLFMLVDVYQAYNHTLPANRGQLFDWFVETLLVRERLLTRDKTTGGAIPQPAGAALLAGLTELAYAMQRRRAGRAGDRSALTTLPPAEAARHLDERQQYQAASANLLTIGEEVRFAHQLLQEYFAARAMRDRIFSSGAGAGVPAAPATLNAADIWPPDRWWPPTNWEEATILLAGLYSDDCAPVLEWVAGANPEVAARCIVESGAHTPDATKKRLRALWRPRLTDLRNDPQPEARAAVGRALGRVTLADGAPLDDRPGVGYVVRAGRTIPDIVWGETVPAGTYTIGGDKDAFQSFDKRRVKIDRPYQLARYPVTYGQFHCFVTAADFADPRWWAGMPAESEVYGQRYHLRQMSEQYFKFLNHPRDSVSWYQAVAFCRWLSEKLGYEVNLPHEYEWEAAARYPDGRFYPWGKQFDAQKANTSAGDRLGQTSAVGIYPQGANSALGLFDLSGNVWEWCRNKFDDPDDDTVDDSGSPRVLRGGSWHNDRDVARAAARVRSFPDYRLPNYGFRLVARRPPSHHDH